MLKCHRSEGMDKKLRVLAGKDRRVSGGSQLWCVLCLCGALLFGVLSQHCVLFISNSNYLDMLIMVKTSSRSFVGHLSGA